MTSSDRLHFQQAIFRGEKNCQKPIIAILRYLRLAINHKFHIHIGESK